MASSDSNDRFYTEPYRYGDRNLELRNLNRNRDLSGVRGYPSNDDYMRLVGKAGIERDQNRMRAEADRVTRSYGTKKKGNRKKARSVKGRR